MRDCVFCNKLENDDDVKWNRSGSVGSFIPLNPVVPGHMLFVPFVHAVNAADDPYVTGMVFEEASRYGWVMGQAFNLITSAGTEATQTVFHLHVHYLPRSANDGLMLPWTNQTKD